MRKNIDFLSYRFGKGAEIHSCSKATTHIYSSIRRVCSDNNIAFSWRETIPAHYHLLNPKDEFGYRPHTLKNKKPVIKAITLLAQQVALSMLTSHALPFVVGGDHTQGLGASKGMILAETVKALIGGRLLLTGHKSVLLKKLRHHIAQRDIKSIISQTEIILRNNVAPSDLQHFLSSIYVIWFDAHGDYNTVETTISGNAHGMSAAAISGEGAAELTGILGEWAKIRPENMHFVAVRDLDPEEEKLMLKKKVHIHPMEEIKAEGLPSVIKKIFQEIERDSLERCGFPALIHLSFDVDGIDAKYVPATGTPVGEGALRNTAKGPSLAETIEAFTGVTERVTVMDMAEANFDREQDPSCTTLASVNALLAGFLSHKEPQSMASQISYG